MKRRSNPIVVPGFSLIPAPPQSEPPMCRPDLGEVSERQQALQRFVETSGALLLVHGKIRSGDVADEERVSRDDEPRLLAAALVRDEGRGVLGPVPRRGQRGDGNVPDRDAVAVGKRLVRKLDAGSGRDVDGRTGRLREPALAGDVVGVVVRLEHVTDAEVVLLRQSR